MFLTFPVCKSLEVHGPCFPLNKDNVNRFWMHTLQAYKHFSCKICPPKAEELVTDNDNIKVGNGNILYKRRIERGVCSIFHLLHENDAFGTSEEFNNVKYGLNTNFLTCNGCIEAVQRYI